MLQNNDIGAQTRELSTAPSLFIGFWWPFDVMNIRLSGYP